MKLDDINLAILKQLKDGRKSFKLIADDLQITENTVRSRVQKMLDEGILSIEGLVDPATLPGHSHVFIGIKLNTTDLVSKGKELSSLKGVVSVNVVTGRYDLIAQALLTEEYSLLEFFTKEMSKISDVRDVETFVVYKGFNSKVPYLI